MSEILVWKEKLQKVYAQYGIYIDKGAQFLMSFVTFFLINKNIGMMKALNSNVVVLVLSLLCTFLPPVCTALVGAVLILAHLSKLSIGVAGVAALIFVLMYIFYCRFTPKKAILLLLTPLAFLLKVPYVVPVVCGLILSPLAVVPVAFGTIVYYMIEYVKTSSAAISGADGIAAQISLFVKAVFQNKQMWIVVIAFAVCIFAVYMIRRLSIDYSWLVAIVTGVVSNVIVIAVGDIVFDIHTSYGGLFLANLAAAVVGIGLEILLFSVDYARTEYLQFEDDEYYYYVKAVPKVSVAVPEKTVKRINERKDTEEMEGEEIRRREPKKSEIRRPVKKSGAQQPKRKAERTSSPVKQNVGPKSRPAGSEQEDRQDFNTEELLLARSLQEELDIQNIVERELEGN